MHARLFSPLLQAVALPTLFLMMACNVGGSQGQQRGLFSLEYRVHRGLDCAMIQDCGYHIDVSQTGALTRYDDPGTGALTQSAHRNLSQQEMTDLHQILEETGFFDFPELLPTEGARAGGGSVVVTYVAWPAQMRKSVMIMTSDPLPESAQRFMSRLNAFFSARLD